MSGNVFSSKEDFINALMYYNMELINSGCNDSKQAIATTVKEALQLTPEQYEYIKKYSKNNTATELLDNILKLLANSMKNDEHCKETMKLVFNSLSILKIIFDKS